MVRFLMSLFKPENDSSAGRRCLKDEYKLCLWWGGEVAHEILVSAQGPSVLGFWVWGLRVWGLGLTINSTVSSKQFYFQVHPWLPIIKGVKAEKNNLRITLTTYLYFVFEIVTYFVYRMVNNYVDMSYPKQSDFQIHPWLPIVKDAQQENKMIENKAEENNKADNNKEEEITKL